jgi:hypothetical protein
MRVLKGCCVEMLIIDEADRFKPKTFAEVRDIFDKLEIPVILVGTDRLDAVIKRDEQVYNGFRSSQKWLGSTSDGSHRYPALAVSGGTFSSGLG